MRIFNYMQRIFQTPRLDNAKAAADFIFDTLKPSKDNFIFGGCLAIAPTNSAAKAILAALAARAESEFGGGIAGLEVLTLEAFLARIASNFRCANPVERQFAMCAAIQSFQEGELPHLFPRGIKKSPAPQNFFDTFLRVKTLCANAGLSISAAAQKMKEKIDRDLARWLDLAQFDGAYAAQLGLASKIDPADALLAALEAPFPAPQKIFLAGIADAPKIFFKIMEKFGAAGCEIFSIIFAEEFLSGEFDAWGAPLESFWTEAEFPISDSDILVCAGPEAEARILAKDVSEIPEAAQNAAVACAEGESSIAISEALAARGIKTFSPEGEKLSQGEIFDFLSALKSFFSAPDFDSLKTIAQKPAVLKYLLEKTGAGAEEVLRVLDFYSLEKLCPDLPSALGNEDGKGKEILLALSELLYAGAAASPASRISQILHNVFSETQTCDKNIAEEAQSLSEALAQIAAAERAFSQGFDICQTLEILLKAADARVFNAVRAPGEVQLKNWLEIFWTPEENIFLADFNDGEVPESIMGDAILPNALREVLGIRGSKSRHARDAYFLRSILEPRRRGAVKFYVPQTDFNSYPLRPSRLLLQTRGLIGRINLLFADIKSDEHSTAFSHSWKFAAPFAPLPSRLSATDFKAYLECPFNYYLTRVLKLKSLDARKSEPDDADIGSIIHLSLQNLKDCESPDEAEIYKFLKGELEKVFISRYGKEFGGVLKFLQIFLLSRLRAAAEVEAARRAEGWRTIYTESDFNNLEIGGFPVSAKIDRLDYNEAKGVYQVVDYKTSNNPVPPEKGHFSGRGAHKKWKSLQLPLYVMSAQKKLGSDNVTAAYFQLPKTSSAAGIAGWNISGKELDWALKTAGEVAAKIKNREFAPSEKSPLLKYNPELFGFAKNKLAKFIEFER